MPEETQKLLAVLIDADNIPAKFAPTILGVIKGLGTPALRRVYGDWSSERFIPWKLMVADLGMVARQETANSRGKNASDIGIVIDAMDLLYTGRFDGFVIVSSDSDFTALANRVRENGLDVIGMGEDKTPQSFRSACTRFVMIENDLADSNGKDATISGKTKLKPEDATPLFVQAMHNIKQGGEWYSMSQIGKSIRASHSKFDPRTYGHKKLSDLAKELKEFETLKKGTQFEMRRCKKGQTP